MKTRFARMMCLLALVGILAIIFLLLRPKPDEPLFWCLIVPAVAANIGYRILSKREDRGYQVRADNWIEEVRKLVGDDDLNSTVERDPHFTDFGTQERKEILLALRRQPRSRRTLDSALIETGLDVREG